MRFGEAVDEWFERQAPYWKSFRTVEQVKGYTGRWKGWWKDRELVRITVKDVAKFEAGRVLQGVGGATLNKERMYLRMFFRWAVQRGVAKTDPTWEWRGRLVGARQVRHWLELEEENMLVRALEPEVVRRYAVFAAATGLRQGTIRALMRADLNISHKGFLVLLLPADYTKEKRPNQIPLSKRAEMAIEEVVRNGKDGPLFPGLPNGPNLDKAFAKASRKAGLPETIRPHDLRRTFMRRARRAGLPLETVMKLTGSKSVQTVLKHYHEIDPGEFEEIRRKLL